MRPADEKQVRWRRPATFEMVQYTDGTGDLLMAVTRDIEGARITGNGSLQAPLTVEIAASTPVAIGVSGGKDSQAAALATVAYLPDWRWSPCFPQD